MSLADTPESTRKSHRRGSQRQRGNQKRVQQPDIHSALSVTAFKARRPECNRDCIMLVSDLLTPAVCHKCRTHQKAQQGFVGVTSGVDW